MIAFVHRCFPISQSGSLGLVLLPCLCVFHQGDVCDRVVAILLLACFTYVRNDGVEMGASYYIVSYTFFSSPPPYIDIVALILWLMINKTKEKKEK